MKKQMHEKLTYLIRELGAFAETYKAEIATVRYSGTGGTNCKDDIDSAIGHLDDAMHEINKAYDDHDDDEHANSSAASYKDYMAEERATTDRGND